MAPYRQQPNRKIANLEEWAPNAHQLWCILKKEGVSADTFFFDRNISDFLKQINSAANIIIQNVLAKARKREERAATAIQSAVRARKDKQTVNERK